MEIGNNRNKWKEYVIIVIGTFLMGISVNLVYEPMEMVTGGVTGLAIVVKYLTSKIFEGGIPVWLTNAIINIPLFIMALILKGKKFIAKTFFATISFTVALYIIPIVPSMQSDMLLAAIFGGVLGGAGLGLIFATGASTGGTDLLGIIIHKYLKHYNLSQLIFIIDGSIVLLGALVFGVNTALYAVIAVFITSKVIDAILEGMKFAKCAYIISDETDKIANSIMHELDRGVTGINATGMYSNTDRKMLMCVVSKKEIVSLIDLVAKNDPKAFIIVNDVREVMGEGFREYRQ